MPEESKPGSGNNLYLENFPSKNIINDQVSLISAIRKYQLVTNEKNKQ